MLWALLAFLGIPLWFLAIALTATIFSRRHFQNQDGVFPLMLREAGEDWPRRPGYGRYVHDVLIVNQGMLQVRTSILVAEEVSRLDLHDQAFKKIEDPIGFALVLDDGSEFEVVMDAADNPVTSPASS